MAAAMKAASDLREDQTCVVLCPDNIRNYMSKFLVDNWMEARKFKKSENIYCHPWWDRTVKELINKQCSSSCFYMASTASCQEVIDELISTKTDHILIIDEEEKLLGLATTTFLMKKILDKSLDPSDSIEKALVKKFTKVTTDVTVGTLSRILEIESVVVAVVHVINRNDCESFPSFKLKNK